MMSEVGKRSREALRAGFHERLASLSRARYGETRRRELEAALQQAADHLAAITLFQLTTEDRPAFLFNKNEPKP
jgi:hypothetical protein